MERDATGADRRGAGKPASRRPAEVRPRLSKAPATKARLTGQKTDAASRAPRPAKTAGNLALTDTPPLTEKIVPFHPRYAERRFN